MPDLKNRIDRRDRIFIYGAGRAGRAVLDWFAALGRADRVISFLDADPKKWGRRIDGLEVRPPDALKGEPGAAVAIALYDPRQLDSALATLRPLAAPDDLFYMIPLLDHYWFDVPGVMDIPLLYPTLNSGLPCRMLTLPRRIAPPERFRAAYDPADHYTQDSLDLIERLIECKAGLNFLPLFQPADFCRKFVSEHLMNETYWTETPELVNAPAYTVCDVGAAHGDSFGFFSLLLGGRLKRLYAFEPEPESLARCRLLAAAAHLGDRVTVHPFALGERDVEDEENINSRWIESPADRLPVATRRLDGLALEIEGKLAIKMDVEGFELAALRGAAETITKHKPDLAICVYHQINDIWAVPEYLKSLVPEYRFILRGGAHLVCYASAT